MYNILHDTIDTVDDAIAFPGLSECNEELMNIALGFEMSRGRKKTLLFCLEAIDGILIPIAKKAEN